MAVMVVSKKYGQCLMAFVYGYARRNIWEEEKKILSILPFPLSPVLVIVIMVVGIFLFWIRHRKNKQQIKLDYFLTRRNEGVILSGDSVPGVLNSRKRDINRITQIAFDNHVIEHGRTPQDIFFVLGKRDLDIFTDDLLNTIEGKNVWLFIEDDGSGAYYNHLTNIGRIILFDPSYVESQCISPLILGIIPRFISMISDESNTNGNHVYHSLPYMGTLSFCFPTDVHSSIASVLQHQKFIYNIHGEGFITITNCSEFTDDLSGTSRYVQADTEEFLICFREIS